MVTNFPIFLLLSPLWFSFGLAQENTKSILRTARDPPAQAGSDPSAAERRQVLNGLEQLCELEQYLQKRPVFSNS